MVSHFSASASLFIPDLNVGQNLWILPEFGVRIAMIFYVAIMKLCPNVSRGFSSFYYFLNYKEVSLYDLSTI